MAEQAGPAISNPQKQNNYATNLRRKFGEIGDFWNRYDRAADAHDRQFVKDLNDNLDVLLIFAGLFSAVNTSFIQMATPSLSPDPSVETNYLLRLLITKLDNSTFSSAPEPPSQGKDLLSVRANCLLYSSLCCSILAAVGTMLAKEWLQNFERGEQGRDSPNEQGLRRQRRFNGMRQWRLEPMTRLLPTLLLISVVLFFFGLIEFLIPVNDSAAGVVIAFTSLGTIFYFLTTSAAALWDACPYQTSVSKASKYVFEVIVIPSIRPLGLWLTRCFGSRKAITGLTAFRTARRGEHEAETLSAQAAWRLIGTTSSPEDQRIAIQNLIILAPGVCSFLIQDWDTYEKMLSLTVHFIETWRHKPSDETVLTAQQFSAALFHLCMGYPRHLVKWNRVKEHLSAQIKAGEHHHGGQRLSGWLELCLSNSPTTFRASPAYIFPSNNYSMKVATLSMIVLGGIPFWSLNREDTWSALWHVFDDKYDDTVLALIALAIWKGFSTSTSESLSEEEVRSLVRNACLGNDIVPILLEGVRYGPIALSDDEHPSYIHALPIFTEILQRLGELPSTKAWIGANPEAFFAHLACLILAVDKVYDTAHSGGASSALKGFMDEALRLLQTFKPPVTQHGSMSIIFDGTLVSFFRCNRGSDSVSTAAIETLGWLELCLGKFDFVADDTISRMMWGLESSESREEVLQLIYTYVSKWLSGVGVRRYKLWISKGLIPQLLKALSSGATTGSINLVVPLVLRHVVNRATSLSWELQEAEEIISVGINVVNSVNSDTGPVGQAYSLLIFEVVLSVWEIIAKERRAKQMSEGMVQATERILLKIEDLMGNQLGTITLTAAMRSKIGFIACSEPFNLSPVAFRRFLSELTAKKADICAKVGLDTIVNRVHGWLSDGTTPGAQSNEDN